MDLALPEVLVEQGSGGTTRYLHLPNAIATDDGLVWSYSATVGLGSVRQQLDASAQVDAVNSYRPFGLPLEGDGGDPYGFTGEWWDGSEDAMGIVADRLGIKMSLVIEDGEVVACAG